VLTPTNAQRQDHCSAVIAAFVAFWNGRILSSKSSMDEFLIEQLLANWAFEGVEGLDIALSFALDVPFEAVQ
jgi:hypothetical protein